MCLIDSMALMCYQENVLVNSSLGEERMLLVSLLSAYNANACMMHSVADKKNTTYMDLIIFLGSVDLIQLYLTVISLVLFSRI